MAPRATMDDYREISRQRYDEIIAAAGHPSDVEWLRVSAKIGGLLFPYPDRRTLCFSCYDRYGIRRFYLHNDAKRWLNAA